MRIRTWVCLLGVTWPDTWHIVSKPLSCFHPLFTREENTVCLRKIVFSSSRMIATTVRGQRASSFTDTLKPVDAQKSRRRKLRVFTNSSRRKKTAIFQHFKRLLFLSSHINAKTPCYSRNDVRYRRVNLKTIGPCDLLDEENLRRRHVIDSSHFNVNKPFLCWRDLFYYGVDTPERA
jgi:hypothetical protein